MDITSGSYDTLTNERRQGIYQLVRATLSQEIQFDMVANNLANIQTPGFKKDSLSFDKTLSEVMRTDFSQGSMKNTDNTFDIALEGDAFFTIQTEAGVRYTKNGNFTLNNEKILVTQNGDPVLGESGPIEIDGSEISIDPNGEIKVDGTRVDNFALASFNNSENLKKEGSSYYTGNPGSIKDVEDIRILQGFLESSNVNVVEEMVKMTQAHRTYESYQKMLQTLIETDVKATTEVGKL
ncbi:Flagellar hook-basal body protein [Candidatus Magnetomoraceae bacterium gMMP-15]